MPVIDSLPQQQQIEYVVLQNARAVHDITAFHFTDYYTESNSNWAVVNITPNYDSGSATIPGGYVNVETGEVVIPPNTAMVTIKKGKWKLLFASQLTYPSASTFEWSEPMEEEKRVLEAEDIYSPFSYGGVIVFKPNPDGEGRDQFLYPRLIFSPWQNMVGPAFKCPKQIRNILDGQGTTGDKAVLASTINQSNALLSALALRESLRLQLVAPKSCGALLHGREPDLVSIFVNLMIITQSLPDQRSEWLQELLITVKNASRPEYLQSLALGAFSAILFESKDREVSKNRGVSKNGIVVLKSIDHRVKALQVISKQAPELFYMLDKSGIR